MTLKGINYLFSLQQEWASIQSLSLEVVQELAKIFKSPQDSYKLIHIAGTNGKGSVTASVSSVLAYSGYKVGTFISPHLHSVNERILISGRPISDDLLDSCLCEIMNAESKLARAPTFFEAITLAAFLAFKSAAVDWAVLEVGLGGRLDATNIIVRPERVAITTIDLDHQHILGNTLSEIAREKAGIIKENSIVYLGKMEAEPTKAIMQVAASKNAEVFEFGKHYSFMLKSDHEFEFRTGNDRVNIRPGLKGSHQIENMALAAAICRSLGCSLESCSLGLERVFWPGRLEEVYYQENQFLLDCAHNPAGMASLGAYLKARALKDLSVIFGALQTKDWQGMVRLLSPHIADWILLEPHSHRRVENQAVQSYLSSIGINNVVLTNTTSKALNEAIKRRPNPPILVCGSMYMVGDVRKELDAREITLW